jgi:hypothetical protein
MLSGSMWLQFMDAEFEPLAVIFGAATIGVFFAFWSTTASRLYPRMFRIRPRVFQVWGYLILAWGGWSVLVLIAHQSR